MTIDTTVPGSPSDIRAAAELLAPSFETAAKYSETAGAVIPVGVRSHWYGESADAYVDILHDVGDASEEVITYAQDGAEKLRSYAGQLERMQSDFAGHREKATAEGIPVSGMVISPPLVTVSACPTSRDDPEWDEWQDYLKKVKTYNRIAEDVGSWWGELEVWVTEHLDGFVKKIPDEGGLLAIVGVLGGAADIPKNYLGFQGELWKLNAESLTAEGARLRDEASAVVRALRSGNPAVRAAAEAANPHGLRWQASEVEELADRLGKAAKWLPGVGWVLDGKDFVEALEGDGSPSTTGLGILGGVGGGILGGALVVGGAALLGVTAPVWVTAGAIVVVGIGVGKGVEWAWENWVPQDVREAIDAGLRDGWDATKDFAEDAWDNTTEFVGDAWHNAGKAWNSLWD